MIQFFKSVVCAVTLLSSAASALGQSAYADSSLNGMRLQLIDLDPNDGIAPSITFLNGVHTTHQVFVVNRNTGEAQSFTVSGLLSDANDRTGVGAEVYLGGVAQTWQTSLENADGGSIGELSQGFPPDGYATARVALAGDFVLSAHTQLVVSGQVIFYANVNPGGEAKGGYGLELSGTTGGGLVSDSQSDSFVLRSAVGGDPSSYTHWDTTLQTSVSLVNTGQTELFGHLHGYVTTVTSGSISPVPEPGSWVLMLGGLLCISVVACCRRRGLSLRP